MLGWSRHGLAETAAGDPPPIAPAMAQALHDRLAAAGGQITFADYMALVLYDPQVGYYAGSGDRVGIGPQGDFVTSPHLCPDFAELLADQVAECWARLGCPPAFDLVEMGAGQGVMAADLLTHLQTAHPDCWAATTYQIVEISPALRAVQRSRLAACAAAGDRVVWSTWETIAPNSIMGCFLSNELVDAFPVHRVIWQGGQLQECYVTASEGHLSDRVGPLSTERLATYFQTLNIDFARGAYPEGYCTEVNLAALDWLATLAERLRSGYLLTIDYGYEAQRFYHPSRSGGTLQCYTRHAHHNDPYWLPGQQDLTAHVDFSALQHWGEQQGLQTLGFTRQSLFLMALGLGDRLMALSQGGAIAQTMDFQKILHRRDVLHRLIDPTGLGNFGVLIQGKNLPPEAIDPPLKGLQEPMGLGFV